MKIKVLQSAANSLCQMCCSAHIASSLELLADIPGNTLKIDLLADSCMHPQRGDLELPLTKDFSAWLAERFKAIEVPLTFLQQALISLQYKTDRVPTDRSRIVLFDLECTSKISVKDRVFMGHASDAIWYNRASTMKH
jgi:hypothetical protein